jgi:hypothetical protein
MCGRTMRWRHRSQEANGRRRLFPPPRRRPRALQLQVASRRSSQVRSNLRSTTGTTVLRTVLYGALGGEGGEGRRGEGVAFCGITGGSWRRQLVRPGDSWWPGGTVLRTVLYLL